MPTTLRDEIRQTRAFTSVEQEAHLNIVRTALELGAHLDDVLKPAGISVAQFNVLRILRGAQPAGLCRGELGERLLGRMPDVTRLLDRMEKQALVARQRETADRRQVRTRITAQGRRVLQNVDAKVATEHERRLGHLGPRELRTLITLLTKVRQSH